MLCSFSRYIDNRNFGDDNCKNLLIINLGWYWVVCGLDRVYMNDILGFKW